jgi:two-component system chemotaxis response regulator CheB
VIAASAGGIKALEHILSVLPDDFPLPIAVVQHRRPHHPSMLPAILGRRTSLRVKTAEHAELMKAGTVYLAPPELHMTIHPDLSVALTDGHKVRHVLSSANPLFASAAKALDGRVIAVVLTGGDRDTTDGVQTVRDAGGIVIAQDEATSEHFGMPGSAIATGCVDRVLPLEQIAGALVRLVKPGNTRNRIR